MELGKQEKNIQDLIYLVACAIHEVEPADEIVRAMDLDEIYRLATKQCISAMLGHVLKNKKELLGAERFNLWNQAEALSVRKNMLMDIERTSILSWMEQQGIWYMPLKGVIIKDMYPAFGMREMSDNDILFDPAARAALHDHMVDLGYRVELYETDKDDQYMKNPVYFFEMHVSLAEDHLYPKIYEYYKDVKERLVPDAGKKYGYHFTDEDFYIFHVAHSEKHTEHSGDGLRSMIDSYVYLTQKPNMDWKYIEEQLELLGMLEFESDMRALAFRLFGTAEYGIYDRCNEDEIRKVEAHVRAGKHGTLSTSIEKYINNVMDTNGGKGGKGAYYMHRLFPDKATMKRNYHVLLKHGWLLPFCHIHRVVRGVLFKRDRISRELNEVRKA
uniref:nucleotidyltransferase domain-containing protein n=1 Tax=Eubacterium cellulosolvens TaxID=29322 RepID=UPI0004836E7D|nr:nucleotidyltransferase family protein [[Eubacterium] cellulosolvens]